MDRTADSGHIFGDNYKFSPLPTFPKDHWINRNRHTWTEEDKTKLYKKYAGDCVIELNSCDVLLQPVDINYKSLVLEDQRNDRSPLICGKVIALGRMAFDKLVCPKGATATYQDYVLFNYEESLDWDLDFHRLVTVYDLNILGVLENPYAARNSILSK